MMVLILQKVRPSLRGRLTRWLIQPQSGVYIGHPSARIRERIWKLVCNEIDTKGGAALLIYPSDSEQGFSILSHGSASKVMRDFDGLVLPKTPLRA